MADEEFDSPDVILDLLGAGQGIANEAHKALPQSIVAVPVLNWRAQFCTDICARPISHAQLVINAAEQK